MLATAQIILVITRHIVRALTIIRGLCALQLWKISPRLTNHLEHFLILAIRLSFVAVVVSNVLGSNQQVHVVHHALKRAPCVRGRSLDSKYSIVGGLYYSSDD